MSSGDTDTFCNPDEANCPYTAFKKTCKSQRDKCGKWVKLMAGKNAQTGEPIYQWACEDSWRPILAIEQVAAINEVDAEIEALRKELTERETTLLQINMEQLKALNNMGILLQKMVGEMTRHNDGLMKLGQARLSSDGEIFNV